MKTAMEQNNDNLVGFISGIAGGVTYLFFAGITWVTAWENVGNILWLGFVALFSGVMGVLGKHWAGKYLKRKSRKP